MTDADWVFAVRVLLAVFHIGDDAMIDARKKIIRREDELRKTNSAVDALVQARAEWLREFVESKSKEKNDGET